jgi:hypothetical protein
VREGNREDKKERKLLVFASSLGCWIKRETEGVQEFFPLLLLLLTETHKGVKEIFLFCLLLLNSQREGAAGAGFYGLLAVAEREREDKLSSSSFFFCWAVDHRRTERVRKEWDLSFPLSWPEQRGRGRELLVLFVELLAGKDESRRRGYFLLSTERHKRDAAQKETLFLFKTPRICRETERVPAGNRENREKDEGCAWTSEESLSIYRSPSGLDRLGSDSSNGWEKVHFT